MLEYQWEIEVLTNNVYLLEAQELAQLAQSLRVDPEYIAKQVAKRIEALLKQRVEKQGLCPRCLSQMIPVTLSECIGYCGNQKAYQEITQGSECEFCGYREGI